MSTETSLSGQQLQMGKLEYQLIKVFPSWITLSPLADVIKTYSVWLGQSFLSVMEPEDTHDLFGGVLPGAHTGRMPWCGFCSPAAELSTFSVSHQVSILHY